LPTTSGYPLAAGAVELLREARKAIAGIRGWADWVETQIQKAEKIGAGPRQ